MTEASIHGLLRYDISSIAGEPACSEVNLMHVVAVSWVNDVAEVGTDS